MRYIVLFEDLDNDHPNWPNERVFKIKDIRSGNISKSCWLSEELAQSIADKKNGK